MRKFQLLLSCLLGLFIGSTFFSPLPGHADGSVVNSDGYRVYQGSNLYWYGIYGHNRVWVPAYTSYGAYYPGYWRYTLAQTYATPQVSYKDPDWRNKLLEIAGNRDKTEGAIRRAGFEQGYFLDAVKALGLQGNFTWNGYGQAPPYAPGAGYSSYGGHGNLQLSSAGVQGNTLYGYSYNSIASIYGDANLSQLYQQANRLAENAQRLSGQATSDFSSLVSQEGGNRARVAEILAKSQAVQEMLRAIDGSSGKFESKTFTFKMVPNGNGGFDVQKIPSSQQGPPGAEQIPVPQGNGAGSPQWQQSAMSCVKCHSGQRKEGSFDVTTYQGLSPEARMRVVSRLVTPNDAKRMPRNDDGTPGPRMNAQELQLWLVN